MQELCVLWFVLYLGGVNMKKSLFVYNEGTLQRHDNTIRFIDTAGNKKDIPIETVGEINIMTQMEFNTSFLNILSQNGIMVHCIIIMIIT